MGKPNHPMDEIGIDSEADHVSGPVRQDEVEQGNLEIRSDEGASAAPAAPRPKRHFTVVTVIGRPSRNIKDFFNSIKFWSYGVEAEDKGMALTQHPMSRPDHKEMLSQGYQVINWYAFESIEGIDIRREASDGRS